MTRQGSTQGGTATDALRDAGQDLLGAVIQRATVSATDRITNFSDRLTNVSEGSESLRSLVRRQGRDGQEEEEGDSEDVEDKEPRPGIFSGLKDKAQGLLDKIRGGGGGKKKIKLVNIVESLDVGLPVRTTYDLWTRYTDFPTFMKKVENVTQSADDKTQWKAQVFLSHRQWEATTVEQVPDSHIVWQSKGAKGHVNGAVTFGELAPNTTRVVLVLEYHPQGLFERTGNLWRAQGRRARLEFKHFRRHAMTQALLHPDEVEGWRGEIRDGEIVKTHEQAMEEEQGPADEQDSEESEPPEEESTEDESTGEDQDFEDEKAEDEDAGDDETEDEDAEAEDYDDADYADEEPDDEGDEEPEDEEPTDEADEEPENEEPADGGDEEPGEEEPKDEGDDTDEEPTPPRRRGRRQPVSRGASS